MIRKMYCLLLKKRCWDNVKNIKDSFDLLDLTLTDEVNSILERNSITIIHGEEVNINKLDPGV